jgi:hypothetical protein
MHTAVSEKLPLLYGVAVNTDVRHWNGMKKYCISAVLSGKEFDVSLYKGFPT